MLSKLIKKSFSTPSMQHFSGDISLLLSRIFFGLTMAFMHGSHKLPPSEQFINFITNLGFPTPFVFAWMAGLTEFVGGMMIALGLATRISSFLMIQTMMVAVFMAHAGDPFKKMELGLCYLFASLLFMSLGAGRYSLDYLIDKKYRRH